MALVETNETVNGHVLSIELLFTDVSGTTDLSGAMPDIDWTMTAKAPFDDPADGASTFNGQTGTFTISISGDWGDTTSSAFTIPALSSGCSGLASDIDAALGLGKSGATLTLYKFGAYDGMPPLHGS